MSLLFSFQLYDTYFLIDDRQIFILLLLIVIAVLFLWFRKRRAKHLL